MKKLANKWITKNSNNRLYQIPVPIIGLTGGIGTGKSIVAKIFKERGIAVIDADRLVKNIYQRPETLEFIKTFFPEAIENSTISFSKLREIAFRDPAQRQKIENYLYK
jgi:dephospho-CoA kinase